MSDDIRVIELRVARGVVLASLASCYPHELSAEALDANVQAHSIYLDEDFGDVLYYLHEKGYIVATLERRAVVRARLHATGMDVVHGLVQDPGVHVSASIPAELTLKRGRVLKVLKLRYPEPLTRATIRLGVARYYGHMEATEAALDPICAYLVDKGLVEAEDKQAIGMSATMYRLRHEGVDLLESQDSLTGITVPKQRVSL